MGVMKHFHDGTNPEEATATMKGEAALADETVSGYLEGKEVVKVIVIPGRLVNIVVK